LGGTVRSGFDILAQASRLEEKIASSDFVITGEGKTDGQTAFGKLPCRIGETAKKYGVSVILISGSVGESAVELYDYGITALFDTVPSPSTLEDVMQNAAKNLEFTAKNVGRMIEKFR
jgi:glycerate kinase